MRVALVTMPFNSVDRPALGVSLLKARLGQMGVPCDVLYPNLAFAKLIGLDVYRAVALELPVGALAGEWVFAECLWDGEARPRDDYVEAILRGRYRLSEQAISQVLVARSLARRFLEDTVSSLAFREYDLIGFSSWCAQTLASLALARRIRDRFPSPLIAFGGPNWRAEAGRELHRVFPFVDFLCSGDADDSFPALVEALRDGDHERLAGIPGLTYRERTTDGSLGIVRTTGEPALFERLDDLPVPDFSDFFAARRSQDGVRSSLATVVLETSRGCWWAETSPCRFCGLDGEDRRFRTKSPSRIIAELRELSARWPTATLYIIDNIVSHLFLDEVLPELVAHPLPVPVYFNVRPDIDKATVRRMGAISASIQPGIESFSDHVLRLMGKGVGMLENIRLLKWCRAFGVRPHWNLLFGFPGETDADYDELLDLLPSIMFMHPPGGIGRLSLDRRSVYFARARRFGITDVVPRASYSYLYPESEVDLGAVAATFDYGYASGRQPPRRERELADAVERWERQYVQGDLRLVTQGESAVLFDSRPGAVARMTRLDPLDTLLYAACDDIRTRRWLHELILRRRALTATLDQVDDRLESFVDRRQMVRSGERFLSLALTSED